MQHHYDPCPDCDRIEAALRDLTKPTGQVKPQTVSNRLRYTQNEAGPHFRNLIRTGRIIQTRYGLRAYEIVTVPLKPKINHPGPKRDNAKALLWCDAIDELNDGTGAPISQLGELLKQKSASSYITSLERCGYVKRVRPGFVETTGKLPPKEES